MISSTKSIGWITSFLHEGTSTMQDLSVILFILNNKDFNILI